MRNTTDIPTSDLLTQLRAGMFIDGVKLLLAANGGGAIALLAFLQSIWGQNTEMAKVVLIGIGCLLGGVALLLPISFIRILHSNKAEQLGNWAKSMLKPRHVVRFGFYTAPFLICRPSRLSQVSLILLFPD